MTGFLLAVLAWGGVFEAQAQPELIRLGYVQCLACHTSAYGSNLLNSYGKSVRASLAAFQKEGDTAQLSQSWINANAFFRYLWIDSANYRDQFLMQSDVGARADFKTKIGTELMVGLVPERVSSRANAPDGILGKRFSMKRALVDYSISDRAKLVFGRDFFARSLNTSNHTSFLRSATRQGVTDTPTQLRFEGFDEKNIYQAALFGPSGEENRDAREYGLFYRFEREFFEQFAAGALVTYGETKVIRRLSPELFARYAPTSQWGVLSAYQHVQRRLKSSGESFGQNVLSFSPFYAPWEWALFSVEAEWLSREAPFQTHAYRRGVRLQTKLLNELTLLTRVDRERTQGRWGETVYSLQLISQL